MMLDNASCTAMCLVPIFISHSIQVVSIELSSHFFTRICLSRDVILPLIGSHTFTYNVPMATRSVNTQEPIGLADVGYVARHSIAFPCHPIR